MRLAAVICATPIATITLVDEDRQWFKAKLGLDIDETPRNIAFCAHTILGRDPLIVPDAKFDPVFAENELVVGPPHLRFYAGFPLLSRGGLAVGTLTVMDRVPRVLTSEQRFASTSRMPASSRSCAGSGSISRKGMGLRGLRRSTPGGAASRSWRAGAWRRLIAGARPRPSRSKGA